MRLRQLFLVGVAAPLLAWMAACDDDDPAIVDEGSDLDPNLVEIAAGSDDFATLTGALETAGLTETLSGAGPYTVFAPTEAAFEDLPEGTLENLSQDQLRTILLYHVVPQNLPSEDLSTGPIDTAADLTAFVQADGDVTINDAAVTNADILASNGVIHGIDAVLMPPDIVGTLELAGNFTGALAAIDRVGLTEELQAEGPFTLFAPTDEALAMLPPGTIEALSDEQVRNVLLYHAVPGRLLSTDLTTGPLDTLLSGAQVDVQLNDDGVMVNDAMVVQPNLLATNGVVHAIDAVLIPTL